jgi:hypothetical protein
MGTLKPSTDMLLCPPTSPEMSNMSKPIVSRPITNAGSWPEELALLYAVKARGAAIAELAHRREDPDSLRSARRALEEAQEVQARVEEVLSARVSKLAALEASADEAAPAVAGSGLIWGLAVLGLVSAVVTDGLVTIVSLAVALIAALFGAQGHAHRKKVLGEHAAKLERHRTDTAAAQEAVEAAEGDVDAARLVSARAREVLAVEEKKPRRSVVQPPVVGIFRARLMLQKVVVAGYEVFVDTSGVLPQSEFTIPGLEHMAVAQRAVSARIAALSHPGPLLRPHGDAPQEVGALVGEEADLRRLLDDWVASLRAVETRRLSVPLIPSTGYLGGKLLSAAKRPLAVDDAPSVVVLRDRARSAGAAESLREIGDALEVLRKGGTGPLKETYSELVQLLRLYSEGRDSVMQTLQGEVMDVLSRSHLLSMRHYCPSCNRVPAYLEHKLGVAFAEAHLLDQQALLERCLHDGAIATRLKKNPQLLRDLRDSHLRYQQLSSDLAAASGPVTTAFKDQLAVYLDEYRARLRELVLGSRRPAVELGSASRLRLRPGTDEWECAACKTTWSDPVLRELGMVSRVKDDLLIPMWNQLWTEKDEFRKSEVFRSNEQLTLYSEKESEKLLQIAESYKADLRGVRERLVVASGEAVSQRLSLEDTLSGLVDLGLMAPERPRDVLTRLDQEGGSEVEGAKRSAERNESMLVAEPRAQQQRRPTAEDPVQVYAQPGLVFDTRLRVPELRTSKQRQVPGASTPMLVEGPAGDLR